MDRVYSIPEEAKHYHCFSSDTEIKKHPRYNAAKSGDAEAAAGRSKEFRALKKHINLLEARFGDEIKDIFGIHISSLTANEASYLVGFRDVDEIRNRCAKAEKETIKRLLSKGYKRPVGR